MNVGDKILVNNVKGIKHPVYLKGFWKFKPFPSCECKVTEKLLARMVKEDIEAGIRVKSERIVPCSPGQAQIVSTNHGYHDINDATLISLAVADDLTSSHHINQHKHHVKIYQEKGDYVYCAKIQLPVSQFPRLFPDEAGT